MFVGFDTSNYTTSVAVFDGKNVFQKKKLLNVKQGERGLRQSDAVFQHTANMPCLIDDIKDVLQNVTAIGVSSRPRSIDGSYMPCFLVGENTAVAASAFCNAPLYRTSHQIGHILAALYSVNRLDLVNEPFIAFHVSGGTTEALLVTPDNYEIINARLIAQSTDLKAGQAIDRAGVMLGLNFPCGAELDKLAAKSSCEYKIKPAVKGLNCSLSGVENQAQKMLNNNEQHEDIAKFVITYIAETLDIMTQNIISEYGELPLLFAGGVMSNSIISKRLGEKYGAYFAEPQFSCDNAAGTAVYAYLKSK